MVVFGYDSVVAQSCDNARFINVRYVCVGHGGGVGPKQGQTGHKTVNTAQWSPAQNLSVSVFDGGAWHLGSLLHHRPVNAGGSNWRMLACDDRAVSNLSEEEQLL